MDAASHILVFEALKRWRHNKTTIVAIHDLSRIESGDFVYVLKDGRAVEQSFRYNLKSLSAEEEDEGGEFRKMVERQSQAGGFLPEKDAPLLKLQEEEELNEPAHFEPKSLPILSRLTIGCSTSLPISPV